MRNKVSTSRMARSISVKRHYVGPRKMCSRYSGTAHQKDKGNLRPNRPLRPWGGRKTHLPGTQARRKRDAATDDAAWLVVRRVFRKGFYNANYSFRSNASPQILESSSSVAQ